MASAPASINVMPGTRFEDVHRPGRKRRSQMIRATALVRAEGCPGIFTHCGGTGTAPPGSDHTTGEFTAR